MALIRMIMSVARLSLKGRFFQRPCHLFPPSVHLYSGTEPLPGALVMIRGFPLKWSKTNYIYWHVLCAVITLLVLFLWLSNAFYCLWAAWPGTWWSGHWTLLDPCTCWTLRKLMCCLFGKGGTKHQCPSFSGVLLWSVSCNPGDTHGKLAVLLDSAASSIHLRFSKPCVFCWQTSYILLLTVSVRLS